PVGSGDLLDVGPQPVVARPEPELGGAPSEDDRGLHLGYLFPGHANPAPSTDPAGEAAYPPRSLAPVTGPDEDRDHPRRLPRTALDRKVVDVAAPTTFTVEHLVIEDVQHEVERGHQFCPTLVMIISGTA